jgi:hypothetical protein
MKDNHLTSASASTLDATVTGSVRRAANQADLNRSLSFKKLARGFSSGRRWPLLCVAIVSALVLLPALFYGVPGNIDLLNHFRFALPFYDSLQAGNLYPGWLAESTGGYGDPSFRFYPPGVYYLLAAARMMTGNWYAGSLLSFTLLSVMGGLGAYLWAQTFLPRRTAIWAGAFYALAPYHVNELYQAFLLAEYAGCAVLPFSFLFVERICQRRRASDIAGLAASFSILILTHLPLTVIGSLALVVYALVRMEHGKRVQTIARLSLAVGLGLAASACYWVMMIGELSWIRANIIETDVSVDYRHNFLFSTFSTDNLNVWWMNILAFATAAMFVPCIALLRRRVRREAFARRGLMATALLLVFAFLMATPLSRPLWMILPPLQEAQFPWRWLALVSLFGSITTAAAIPYWLEKSRGRARPVALLIAGSVLISLALTSSHIIREARYLSRAQFESTLASIPGSPSINYWLPIWVKQSPRNMSASVEVESRALTVDSWEAQSRTFRVGPGAATEARVRTFYYPHWTATARGRKLMLRAAEDGALLISLPAEEVAVELNFEEPLRTRAAASASIIGWSLIGVLFVSGLRKRFRNEYDSEDSTLD